MKAGKFAPVYILHGEETYFTDSISDYIETHALQEHEKGFNQTVYYAKDIDPKGLMEAARRFPMMANYQVIIVKEAQGFKSLEDFESYLAKPVPSTILVFCVKGKKLDKRTRFYKLADKHVTFESRRLYDNELQNWILTHLKGLNYIIEPRLAALIAESLGSDLAKVSNELQKLFINLGDRRQITDADIEENIGISKDYNSFELLSAIAAKNTHRAFKISHHLGRAKDFSIIPFLSQLNNLFSKAYIISKTNTRDKKTIQSAFGLNFYQAEDMMNLVRNYKSRDIENTLALAAEYDLKSKGINSPQVGDSELMKELLVKIF